MYYISVSKIIGPNDKQILTRQKVKFVVEERRLGQRCVMSNRTKTLTPVESQQTRRLKIRQLQARADLLCLRLYFLLDIDGHHFNLN